MARRNLAAISDKLVKLIPRLGSPFDGERLATVAAIERVLKSNGRADLAGAIAPRESSKPERGAPGAGFRVDQWRLDVRALLGSGAKLTAWERRFCAPLLNFPWLSEKQTTCVADILQKHGRRAAA